MARTVFGVTVTILMYGFITFITTNTGLNSVEGGVNLSVALGVGCRVAVGVQAVVGAYVYVRSVSTELCG